MNRKPAAGVRNANTHRNKGCYVLENNLELRLLREKIMKHLANKNKRLLVDMLGRGHLTIKEVLENIKNMAWETWFVPLQYEEIEAIWNKLWNKIKKANSGKLLSYLLDLPSFTHLRKAHFGVAWFAI
jgi:hypothetical protein